MAYRVIKWVKGRPYLYEQSSFRVGGKVRTESKYLGPASDADVKAIYRGKTSRDDFVAASTSASTKFTAQKPFPKEISPQELYEFQTTPITTIRTFGGYDDLSTVTLEQLKERTVVSRQYIEDLSRVDGLKQAERALIRGVLAEMGGQEIAVDDFAEKVRTEILSLQPQCVQRPRYEMTGLPDALRGEVARYEEIIYQAPFRTGGDISHFLGTAEGYFAHVRIDDLVDNKTRRLLELQSDLFQRNAQDRLDEAAYAKLAPYRNRWHERILKEEIRRAALDGKTELRIPTGKTSALIEGFVFPEPHPTELPSEVVPGEMYTVWNEDGDAEEYVVLRVHENGETASVIWREAVKRQFTWEVVKDEALATLIEDISSNPSYFEEEAHRFLQLDEGAHRQFLEDPDVLDVHRLAERMFADRYRAGFGETEAERWARIQTENIGLQYVAGYTPDMEVIIYELRSSGFIIELGIGDEASHSLDDFDPDRLSESKYRVYQFYERDIAKSLKRIAPDYQLVQDEQKVDWYAVPIRTKDASSVPPPVLAFKSRGQQIPQTGDINQAAEKTTSRQHWQTGSRIDSMLSPAPDATQSHAGSPDSASNQPRVAKTRASVVDDELKFGVHQKSARVSESKSVKSKPSVITTKIPLVAPSPIFTAKIDFKAKGISEPALRKEQDLFLRRLERLGLDTSAFPNITLKYGNRVAHRRQKDGYLVTLQRHGRGQRTQFKDAFSQALVRAGLDLLSKQQPERYVQLMERLDESFRRTQGLLRSFILHSTDKKKRFKWIALMLWGNMTQLHRNVSGDARKVGVID